MKKSLIATGAASLALAAMPIAGVFAAATPAGDITDTLNVNIPAGCTIVNSLNPQAPANGSNPAITNSYTVEMQNGEFRTNIGGTNDATTSGGAVNVVDVSCNTGSGAGAEAGWKLTAVGAGTEDHETELYKSGSDTIVTGLAESAGQTDVSNWAFKVTKASSATYANSYNSGNGGYMAVPDQETDLITGSGSITGAFTMNYQVYVSQTQPTGTYTGAVKYTLYNPAS